MNKTILVLMLALIIVLSASAVEATLVVNKYTNDFTLASPYNEQIKACSCETKLDNLMIENVGNFYANFHVEIISPVDGWMTLSEEDFSLAPKHKKNIINYITAPCGEVGTYEYTVKVTSSYGRVEYLKRTVRADKCENLILTADPRQRTTNLCTKNDFNITLKNVGTYADNFQLSFGSYNENVNITNREIYLKPNQVYTQTATVLLPCTFYGEYVIPVIATGSKNRVEDETTITLNVENQFDHALKIPTDVLICSRVTQEFPLVVSNEIDVENQFSIILKGPNFIDVKNDERTLSLDGSENKTVILESKPKEGQEGDYTLTVSVESKFGEVIKSRDVSVAVRNCYDFDIEMRNPQSEVIDEHRACCGLQEYFLNVRNMGDTEETYNLQVGGPSWIEADEVTVRLNPGENKNVRILSDNPCVDASFQIPITVVNNRFPEVNETFIFDLETLTQRSCHQVNINDDEFSITKDAGIVPVIVEHNGTEGGVYDIELDSSLFEPVEESMLIFPGERKVMHLRPVEGINELDFGRYISKPTFTYSTEANPQVEDDIVYIEHVGTQLSDWNIFSKFWGWLTSINYGAPGVCGWFGIFLLLLVIIAVIILVLLLNGGIEGMRTGWDNAALATIKLVLIALVIIIFVLLALIKVPEPSTFYDVPKDAGEYFVVVQQDNVGYVNLNKYFDDPDMDSLTFAASQPKDISAAIEDETMILRPDSGFTGINQIVVTAYDGKGGVSDSPVLDIYVMARKDLGFMGYWRLFCVQVNLVLLLLLFLVLIVWTFLFDEEPEIVKKRVYTVIPVDKKYHVVARAKAPMAVSKPKPTPKKVVKTTPKKAPKVVPKPIVKPKRVISAEEQARRTKAIDRALVSTEEHEMRTVLGFHKKRQTAANIEKLQTMLRQFKRAPGYKPKNRVNFYRYLKEKKLLAKLEGFPRPKKVVPKPVVKPKRVISAEVLARRTKAIDRALVSAQEHEMKQVLGFHKKRQTAENVEKLQAMLKQFKSAAYYRPKNRENFYRYLKEKKLLAKLEGFPRPKKVVKVAPKKVARKMSAAEMRKRKMALDRALVSTQAHEMRQVLSTHNKKQSARNVEVLRQALDEFKNSRGFKPKNRINFYRYLDEKDWMRRLHNK